MPLTRTNVTVASRIMLPTYGLIAAGLGVVYTFDPFNRNAGNSALAFAVTIMPLFVWGCLFLAVSALMAWSMRCHNRSSMIFALYVFAGAMTLWALAFLVAVIAFGAPLTAPQWPLFAAVCCHASAQSLLKGEV